MTRSSYEQLQWSRDPAASGWRSRTWPSPGWELLVYDRGDWMVCGPDPYQAIAHGKEEGDAPYNEHYDINDRTTDDAARAWTGCEAAKKRAYAVFVALSSEP